MSSAGHQRKIDKVYNQTLRSLSLVACLAAVLAPDLRAQSQSGSAPAGPVGPAIVLPGPTAPLPPPPGGGSQGGGTTVYPPGTYTPGPSIVIPPPANPFPPVIQPGAAPGTSAPGTATPGTGTAPASGKKGGGRRSSGGQQPAVAQPTAPPRPADSKIARENREDAASRAKGLLKSQTGTSLSISHESKPDASLTLEELGALVEELGEIADIQDPSEFSMFGDAPDIPLLDADPAADALAADAKKAKAQSDSNAADDGAVNQDDQSTQSENGKQLSDEEIQKRKNIPGRARQADQEAKLKAQQDAVDANKAKLDAETEAITKTQNEQAARDRQLKADKEKAKRGWPGPPPERPDPNCRGPRCAGLRAQEKANSAKLNATNKQLNDNQQAHGKLGIKQRNIDRGRATISAERDKGIGLDPNEKLRRLANNEQARLQKNLKQARSQGQAAVDKLKAQEAKYKEAGRTTPKSLERAITQAEQQQGKAVQQAQKAQNQFIDQHVQNMEKLLANTKGGKLAELQRKEAKLAKKEQSLSRADQVQKDRLLKKVEQIDREVTRGKMLSTAHQQAFSKSFTALEGQKQQTQTKLDGQEADLSQAKQDLKDLEKAGTATKSQIRRGQDNVKKLNKRVQSTQKKLTGLNQQYQQNAEKQKLIDPKGYASRLQNEAGGHQKNAQQLTETLPGLAKDVVTARTAFEDYKKANPKDKRGIRTAEGKYLSAKTNLGAAQAQIQTQNELVQKKAQSASQAGDYAGQQQQLRNSGWLGLEGNPGGLSDMASLSNADLVSNSKRLANALNKYDSAKSRIGKGGNQPAITDMASSNYQDTKNRHDTATAAAENAANRVKNYSQQHGVNQKKLDAAKAEAQRNPTAANQNKVKQAEYNLGESQKGWKKAFRDHRIASYEAGQAKVELGVSQAEAGAERASNFVSEYNQSFGDTIDGNGNVRAKALANSVKAFENGAKTLLKRETQIDGLTGQQQAIQGRIHQATSGGAKPNDPNLAKATQKAADLGVRIDHANEQQIKSMNRLRKAGHDVNQNDNGQVVVSTKNPLVNDYLRKHSEGSQTEYASAGSRPSSVQPYSGAQLTGNAETPTPAPQPEMRPGNMSGSPKPQIDPKSSSEKSEAPKAKTPSIREGLERVIGPPPEVVKRAQDTSGAVLASPSGSGKLRPAWSDDPEVREAQRRMAERDRNMWAEAGTEVDKSKPEKKSTAKAEPEKKTEKKAEKIETKPAKTSDKKPATSAKKEPPKRAASTDKKGTSERDKPVLVSDVMYGGKKPPKAPPKPKPKSQWTDADLVADAQRRQAKRDRQLWREAGRDVPEKKDPGAAVQDSGKTDESGDQQVDGKQEQADEAAEKKPAKQKPNETRVATADKPEKKPAVAPPKSPPKAPPKKKLTSPEIRRLGTIASELGRYRNLTRTLETAHKKETDPKERQENLERMAWIEEQRRKLFEESDKIRGIESEDEGKRKDGTRSREKPVLVSDVMYGDKPPPAPPPEKPKSQWTDADYMKDAQRRQVESDRAMLRVAEQERGDASGQKTTVADGASDDKDKEPGAKQKEEDRAEKKKPDDEKQGTRKREKPVLVSDVMYGGNDPVAKPPPAAKAKDKPATKERDKAIENAEKDLDKLNEEWVKEVDEGKKKDLEGKMAGASQRLRDLRDRPDWMPASSPTASTTRKKKEEQKETEQEKPVEVKPVPEPVKEEPTQLASTAKTKTKEKEKKKEEPPKEVEEMPKEVEIDSAVDDFDANQAVREKEKQKKRARRSKDKTIRDMTAYLEDEEEQIKLQGDLDRAKKRLASIVKDQPKEEVKKPDKKTETVPVDPMDLAREALKLGRFYIAATALAQKIDQLETSGDRIEVMNTLHEIITIMKIVRAKTNDPKATKEQKDVMLSFLEMVGEKTAKLIAFEQKARERETGSVIASLEDAKAKAGDDYKSKQKVWHQQRRLENALSEIRELSKMKMIAQMGRLTKAQITGVSAKEVNILYTRISALEAEIRKDFSGFDKDDLDSTDGLKLKRKMGELNGLRAERDGYKDFDVLAAGGKKSDDPRKLTYKTAKTARDSAIQTAFDDLNGFKLGQPWSTVQDQRRSDKDIEGVREKLRMGNTRVGGSGLTDLDHILLQNEESYLETRMAQLINEDPTMTKKAWRQTWENLLEGEGKIRKKWGNPTFVLFPSTYAYNKERGDKLYAQLEARKSTYHDEDFKEAVKNGDMPAAMRAYRLGKDKQLADQLDVYSEYMTIEDATKVGIIQSMRIRLYGDETADKLEKLTAVQTKLWPVLIRAANNPIEKLSADDKAVLKKNGFIKDDNYHIDPRRGLGRITVASDFAVKSSLDKHLSVRGAVELMATVALPGGAAGKLSQMAFAARAAKATSLGGKTLIAGAALTTEAALFTGFSRAAQVSINQDLLTDNNYWSMDAVGEEFVHNMAVMGVLKVFGKGAHKGREFLKTRMIETLAKSPVKQQLFRIATGGATIAAEAEVLTVLNAKLQGNSITQDEFDDNLLLVLMLKGTHTGPKEFSKKDVARHQKMRQKQVAAAEAKKAIQTQTRDTSAEPEIQIADIETVPTGPKPVDTQVIKVPHVVQPAAPGGGKATQAKPATQAGKTKRPAGHETQTIDVPRTRERAKEKTAEKDKPKKPPTKPEVVEVPTKKQPTIDPANKGPRAKPKPTEMAKATTTKAKKKAAPAKPKKGKPEAKKKKKKDGSMKDMPDLPEWNLPVSREEAMDIFLRRMKGKNKTPEWALEKGHITKEQYDAVKRLQHEINLLMPEVAKAAAKRNREPGHKATDLQIEWWKAHPNFGKALESRMTDLVKLAASKGNEAAAAMLKDIKSGEFILTFDPALDALGAYSKPKPGNKPRLRVNPFARTKMFDGKEKSHLRSLDDIASTLLHEYMHMLGYGELRAFEAQYEFLNQVGRADAVKMEAAAKYAQEMGKDPLAGQLNLINKVEGMYLDHYVKELGLTQEAALHIVFAAVNGRGPIRPAAEVGRTELLTEAMLESHKGRGSSDLIKDLKKSSKSPQDLASKARQAFLKQADVSVDPAAPEAIQGLKQTVKEVIQYASRQLENRLLEKKEAERISADWATKEKAAKEGSADQARYRDLRLKKEAVVAEKDSRATRYLQRMQSLADGLALASRPKSTVDLKISEKSIEPIDLQSKFEADRVEYESILQDSQKQKAKLKSSDPLDRAQATRNIRANTTRLTGISKRVGGEGATEAMRRMYEKPQKIFEDDVGGGGAGEVDSVWYADGRVIVVEAKGGASKPGVAQSKVFEGEVANQATLAHTLETATKMWMRGERLIAEGKVESGKMLQYGADAIFYGYRTGGLDIYVISTGWKVSSGKSGPKKVQVLETQIQKAELRDTRFD